jgi:hypothetical protein
MKRQTGALEFSLFAAFGKFALATSYFCVYFDFFSFVIRLVLASLRQQSQINWTSATRLLD